MHAMDIFIQLEVLRLRFQSDVDIIHDVAKHALMTNPPLQLRDE